jgi:hypothetical protein
MRHNPVEDNEIGISLEDESPSQLIKKEDFADPALAAPQPAPLHSMAQYAGIDPNNTRKRAYDDALATRGLISVSRSCERLTDLALPAKTQRTLSQELIRKQQVPQEELDSQSYSYCEYVYTSNPLADQQTSHRYPDQRPAEPQGSQPQTYNPHVSVFSSDLSEADGRVHIP